GVEESTKYDKVNAALDNGMTLSLNTTNTQTLGLAYGTNSDKWVEKEIELYVGEVEFQNKPQEAVLVRAISPPVPHKAQPKKKLKDDLEDETPLGTRGEKEEAAGGRLQCSGCWLENQNVVIQRQP